jgi:hypothetical protein
VPNPHNRHQSCPNCRYYDPPYEGENLGTCCRFPPQVVFLAAPPGSFHGKTVTLFPQVEEEDWCGEWQSISAAPRTVEPA